MSQIPKCYKVTVVLSYWEALGEVSQLSYKSLLFISSKRSYCSSHVLKLLKLNLITSSTTGLKMTGMKQLKIPWIERGWTCGQVVSYFDCFPWILHFWQLSCIIGRCVWGWQGCWHIHIWFWIPVDSSCESHAVRTFEVKTYHCQQDNNISTFVLAANKVGKRLFHKSGQLQLLSWPRTWRALGV